MLYKHGFAVQTHATCVISIHPSFICPSMYPQIFYYIIKEIVIYFFYTDDTYRVLNHYQNIILLFSMAHYKVKLQDSFVTVIRYTCLFAPVFQGTA